MFCIVVTAVSRCLCRCSPRAWPRRVLLVYGRPCCYEHSRKINLHVHVMCAHGEDSSSFIDINPEEEEVGFGHILFYYIPGIVHVRLLAARRLIRMLVGDGVVSNMHIYVDRR